MSDRDRTEAEASGEEESKGAVMAALFANLGIAITKFIAAALSGSAAMVAEGIHSCVDTLNQLCLLYGLKRSKKPADEAHPLGYGKEVFFWSFVVAVLLFSLGAGLSIYEGVHSLLTGHAHSGESFPWIGMGVLIVAFCFEGYSLSVAFRSFQKTRAGKGLWRDFRAMKDPSIFVVLLEDSAALTGILIAGLGLMLSWATGHHAFDAAASIGIGMLLAAVAVLLAQEVRELLIGEAARPEVIDAVRRKLERDEITAVNEIRSIHLGPRDILVLASVDFRDAVTAGEIERIVTETDESIHADHPEVKRFYLEVQSARGHAATTAADEAEIMA